MVVDNLFGIAFEHLFRCRTKTIGLCVGRAEIDDVFDAHGVSPPEIAACVIRKTKVYVY